MLPISPKWDPFFSLKYSCLPKRDIGFNTSRPSERLSLAWRILSRSSENQVAWARPSWSINSLCIRKWRQLEILEKIADLLELRPRATDFIFSSSSSLALRILIATMSGYSLSLGLNVIYSNLDVIWWYLYIALLFLLNVGIIVLFLMLDSSWSIDVLILIFRSYQKVFLKIWFE